MENRQEVVVTDIKMPFMSMVVFMIKWAIASIPAFMLLSMSAAAENGGNFIGFGQDRRGKRNGAPSRFLAES